jgi:hypothetical protein
VGFVCVCAVCRSSSLLFLLWVSPRLVSCALSVCSLCPFPRSSVLAVAALAAPLSRCPAACAVRAWGAAEYLGVRLKRGDMLGIVLARRGGV